MELKPEDIQKIITEINNPEEKNRRARQLRRLKFYRDGGKEFLIEQIKREFSADAVNEMRLAPINILKKVINKRSSVYKQPPIRQATGNEKFIERDQKLVDFYSVELGLDQKMQKANRYFNLFSNTALYTRIKDMFMDLMIVPPHLYSIIADPLDKTKVHTWCFSAFMDEGLVAPNSDLSAATGVESYSKEKGFKTAGDLVESEEKQNGAQNNSYIFWNETQHFTTNDSGSRFFNPEIPEDQQFLNPFGITPVVNLAKDRDNEPWATQGEDLVDNCAALQLGWTDLLTIAKHQGFSILNVVSEEEPKKLTIGINRAIWLKAKKDGVVPTIGYVQANSPLAEYKEVLMDLLGITLSTNDMSTNEVGGKGSAKTFTSGFHALIEASSTLEAIEGDKPVLREAEQDQWQVISKVHNWQYDNDLLREDARALGKFSDDFEVSIQYRDIKPIESEKERLDTVKELLSLGLSTKVDALKKLYPDLSEKQIEEKLVEINKEKQESIALMQSSMKDNPKEEGLDAEKEEEIQKE